MQNLAIQITIRHVRHVGNNYGGMMEQDISTIAALYLKELHENGMQPTRVLHESVRLKSSSIYGDADARDFLRKMDREFKQRLLLEKEQTGLVRKGKHMVRYDITDVPDKFVLKYKHKFFYGMKNSETIWTYDIRFALPLTEIEADAIGGWLENFGTPVFKFPALIQHERNIL